MKRAGLIALCLLLAFSLPATAAKNANVRKARVQAKKPKPHIQPTAPAKPAIARDDDPTKSWQPYSYP